MRSANHDTSFPTGDEPQIRKISEHKSLPANSPDLAPTHPPRSTAPVACPLPPSDKGGGALVAKEPSKPGPGNKVKAGRFRILGDSAAKPATASTSVPGAKRVAAKATRRRVREPIPNMPVRKPSRRKQKVTLREAMREQGLDEQKLAATIAGTLDRLCSGGPEDSVSKCLVDVIKESVRVLDTPRNLDRTNYGDGAVTVELVHEVPRPERVKP
jgi:hypothetical protein